MEILLATPCWRTRQHTKVKLQRSLLRSSCGYGLKSYSKCSLYRPRNCLGWFNRKKQEKGILYELGDFPWSASGKAMILNAVQGKTKVLFDPNTKRVLGGAVVDSAGDLISICLARNGLRCRRYCFNSSPSSNFR